VRIVTLSQWYWPEPEVRAHVLARDLARRGHRVTSITGFPNYPHGRIYPGYRQRPVSVEQLDGVRLVRLPLFPSRSRSAVGRTLNYGSFAASTALLGPFVSGPADVLWVYHPPITITLGARSISAARRVPFVLEIQDLWPDTLAATGMVRQPWLLKAVGALALASYRAAAAIVVISPGFKRALIARGVPEGKIEVLPNWADEDIYAPAQRDVALVAELGIEGKFTVVFAGNMGPAQDLGNLLEAAERLLDVPSIVFLLVGDGVDLPALRRDAERRRLTNVRFLERRPASAMPNLFSVADALLVHLRRDPLFEITIPSKTVAYLACGRPVISVSAGDAAKVVTDAGAGIVCNPGRPDELAAAVRNLYAMPTQARETMGRAARSSYEANFTRAIIFARYEDLLRRVAHRHRFREDGLESRPS